MGLLPVAEGGSEARLLLYTFRQGALSAVGHDLCFSVAARVRTAIEGSQVRIEVTAALSEIQLLGSVPERITPDALAPGSWLPTLSKISARDEAKIQRAAMSEVLSVGHYPNSTWRGFTSVEAYAGKRLRVEGSLELRGRENAQEVFVSRQAGAVLGTCELRPSSWGIAPYSTLLGALRLEDRVLVALQLEAD